MTKLIVFDWDDVFTLGSKEGYFHCYHETLVKLGVNLPEDKENKIILDTWGQTFRQVLSILLIDEPELLDKACEIMDELFFGDAFIEMLTLVPGSVELLNNLSQNYKLAIATGQHSELLIKRIFPKYNIPDVFEVIWTSDKLPDPEFTKPHPFMLENTLEQLKLKPIEAVFVGDAPNDIAMADSAGFTPIAVLTGHLSRGEAEELGVSKIIEDVTHLKEVL